MHSTLYSILKDAIEDINTTAQVDSEGIKANMPTGPRKKKNNAKHTHTNLAKAPLALNIQDITYTLIPGTHRETGMPYILIELSLIHI